MTTDLRKAVFDALGDVLQQDRHEKTLLCRILLRLCVIDGELHPAEQAVLDATMARHGLDAAAQARILAEGRALLDPAGADAVAAADAAIPVLALVQQIPVAALDELLVHLEHGAWADGRVVAAEAALIQAVRDHQRSVAHEERS